MTVAVSEELSNEENQTLQSASDHAGGGDGGQKKTKAGQCPVCGCGRFGFAFSFLSGSCRVGRLGIVDFDVVDFSNLQRQILHTTHDVGRPKLESAREKT